MIEVTCGAASNRRDSNGSTAERSDDENEEFRPITGASKRGKNDATTWLKVLSRSDHFTRLDSGVSKRRHGERSRRNQPENRRIGTEVEANLTDGAPFVACAHPS